MFGNVVRYCITPWWWVRGLKQPDRPPFKFGLFICLASHVIHFPEQRTALYVVFMPLQDLWPVALLMAQPLYNNGAGRNTKHNQDDARTRTLLNGANGGTSS